MELDERHGCSGCEDGICQECCPHNEYDHDICLDCGYERDPGEAIDAAEYSYGDER